MTSTNAILATLAATGIATSAAIFVAQDDETEAAPKPAAATQPKTTKPAQPAPAPAAETAVEVEVKAEAPAEPEKKYRTNRAKIHTRNTLLGAAALNELLTDGGGKDDRRKAIVGATIANELLRKEHERVEEDGK